MTGRTIALMMTAAVVGTMLEAADHTMIGNGMRTGEVACMTTNKAAEQHTMTVAELMIQAKVAATAEVMTSVLRTVKRLGRMTWIHVEFRIHVEFLPIAAFNLKGLGNANTEIPASSVTIRIH